MKPISDTVPDGEGSGRPARLLALGFLAREARLEVGAVIEIVASAIQMLQDNMAGHGDAYICADENGRWLPSLGDRRTADLDGFPESAAPVARIVTIAAIMTPVEHISHWGHAIPVELEIAKGLSAVIYGRQAFKSAFLTFAGDAQDALTQGGRLIVDVEGVDGSGEKLHQAVAWDLRPARNGGRLDRPDARRAFTELLSLAETVRDGSPEIAVALDFALSRRRLVENDATTGTAQCIVVQLQHIWLTQAGRATSHHPQLKSMPSAETVSVRGPISRRPGLA